ncbi:hypothetical protein GJV18_15900 [Pseudomonas sp. R-22-3w-18]|uniref:Uncharacterized protein n=1 Tax=Pseudomonas xionganensis TaxID=2654845 RepID=A0A6I4KWM3_9PSED|nr:hypothetical protein [Pseudomonas xionganensis]
MHSPCAVKLSACKNPKKERHHLRGPL